MWCHHDPPCSHHVLAGHDHCRDWRMGSGGDAMTTQKKFGSDMFRHPTPQHIKGCIMKQLFDAFPLGQTTELSIARRAVEAGLADALKQNSDELRMHHG